MRSGSLSRLPKAIKRGNQLKCSECNSKGATIGSGQGWGRGSQSRWGVAIRRRAHLPVRPRCNHRKCKRTFHFRCAVSAHCVFALNKQVTDHPKPRVKLKLSRALTLHALARTDLPDDVCAYRCIAMSTRIASATNLPWIRLRNAGLVGFNKPTH